MAQEKMPIHVFVATRWSNPQVQKLVEGWRVEPADVIEKLIEHFRDMAIFEVPYGHETLMLNNLIFQLKHSPELVKMLQKVKADEAKRQRARHAD